MNKKNQLQRFNEFFGAIEDLDENKEGTLSGGFSVLMPEQMLKLKGGLFDPPAGSNNGNCGNCGTCTPPPTNNGNCGNCGTCME